MSEGKCPKDSISIPGAAGQISVSSPRLLKVSLRACHCDTAFTLLTGFEQLKNNVVIQVFKSNKSLNKMFVVWQTILMIIKL